MADVKKINGYDIRDDSKYELPSGGIPASDLAETYVLRSTGNLDLNTSAASSTDDGALYAAITALGWQSDVII